MALGDAPGPRAAEALSARPASEAAPPSRGVEGRRVGLRDGESCGDGDEAPSSSAFSASRGAGAPAGPHAAQGGRGGSARLLAGPSDARLGPHFKALLTTSRPPARRPPAPLLSGRLRAQAQYDRPRRLRVQRACARLRPGQQRGRRTRRRGPSTAPPPPTEGLRERPKQQPASCPRLPRGRRAPSTGVRSRRQRCRHATSRHRPNARNRLSPQRAITGEPTQPSLPGHRPLGASTFVTGPPATRRAGPDGSFRKPVGAHACQSGGRLGYCVRPLISGGRAARTPEG